MTFFKVDHSESKDFSPIPEGEYEAVISEVEKKEYKSGNQGLNVKLQIRADVEQEAKKRVVFDTLVVLDTAMFKFQNYAKATSLPDGKGFSSQEELLKGFAKHLKGKPVRIKIKHDNTRDKYIEQVFAVLPPQASGAVAGANPFNAGAGTPPPLPPEPSINNAGPEGGQASGTPPWEQ